ncbi:MAG: uroporphyrinogen-III synthase, partial [Betaproteobacteria bacterium]
MRGKTIAVLESRFGEHLAGLLEKQGARVLRAPALAEEPDVDPGAIRRLIESCTTQPLELAIFQTGVGTRALFDATDDLGLTERLHALLDACRVVVRGPKPTAVLRGRSVRIDISAAEPFTTTEVLAAIGSVDLANKRVLVQRYGDTNAGLEAQLQARGA